VNRWKLSAYDRQPAALGFEAARFVTAGHVDKTLEIIVHPPGNLLQIS
jgi:hypothetical protein